MAAATDAERSEKSAIYADLEPASGRSAIRIIQYSARLMSSERRASQLEPARSEQMACHVLAALDEDVVDMPLGLVALNWIRMFLPLVSSGLPQVPGNAGPDGLGFAREGFRALSTIDVAAQDLRVGTQFTGERARAIGKALAEAKNTIARMPANFIRYPNSEARVFDAAPQTGLRVRETLVLDSGSMGAYGSLSVPGHVWRAMQRLGAWIEPVLVAEWARMMRAYAERMGRLVAPGVAEAALIWLEPSRDTAIARQVAKRLFEAGRPLRCVWTGKRLRPDGCHDDSPCSGEPIVRRSVMHYQSSGGRA